MVYLHATLGDVKDSMSPTLYAFHFWFYFSFSFSFCLPSKGPKARPGEEEGQAEVTRKTTSMP